MSVGLTKEQRDALPDEAFAVPAKRKLPMPDARHVSLAWAQIGRASGLSDQERTNARSSIRSRACELGLDTTAWDRIGSLALNAMAIQIPEVEDHPNRMPFSGVLTKIDEPSCAPPGGSGGKLVIITRMAAEAALNSLAVMAVDYTPGFDGHDAQRKIGVITGAHIDGNDLRIEGIIYAADFPEEAAEIKRNKNALGFSFEAKQILVESVESDPLVVESCVFTGAAILLKDKAAYTTTSLAAAAATDLGDIEMTKEELAALMAETLAPITAKLTALEAGQAQLDGKLEAGKELAAKVAPFADKLRSTASGMQAAGIGMHATRGHVATLNRMADGMEAEAMGGSMPHIFRDHDYAGGSWNAGAAAAEDPAVKAKAVADAAEIADLKSKVSTLETKAVDALAAARADVQPPERKTLSPQITSLLAKAGVSDASSENKMSLAAVDQMLAAQNMDVSKRMVLKQELYRAGVIAA